MSTNANAGINPVYSSCLERGFEVEGDSCRFPDGTACLLDEFNRGICGEDWFSRPFCVEEGAYVWNEANCCPGLSAIHPVNGDGQSICGKNEKSESVKWIYNPVLWALFLIGLAFLAAGVKKLIH